jgi:hypothetical protein
MAHMVDCHTVTYNAKKEDAFIVHLLHKQVKFCCNPDGLYIFKPPQHKRQEPDNKVQAQFITTVAENRGFYTPCQFEQAKHAHELFHSLGHPSVSDMKAIIRMNAIKNNPNTTKDIEMAEKIFGPDISSLKGKTTR